MCAFRASSPYPPLPSPRFSFRAPSPQSLSPSPALGPLQHADLQVRSLVNAFRLHPTGNSHLISVDQENWKKHHFEWNPISTEEEWVLHILNCPSSFTQQDALPLLFQALTNFLADQAFKSLSNETIVIRGNLKPGRVSKITLYTSSIKLLGEGASNIANVVAGVSFVTRENGLITTKGLRPYVRLDPIHTEVSIEGYQTQQFLHEKGRELFQREAVVEGIALNEKAELKGIARAPLAVRPQVYEKYYKGGDLYQFVQHEKTTPLVLLRAYKEVLLGLRALVHFYARHIDLKPRNLVVDIKKPHLSIKIRDFGDVHFCPPLTSETTEEEIESIIKNPPFTISENFTPAYSVMQEGLHLTELQVNAKEAGKTFLSNRDKSTFIAAWNAFLTPIEKFQVFQIGVTLFETLGGVNQLSSLRMAPPLAIFLTLPTEEIIKNLVNGLILSKNQKAALITFFMKTIGSPLETRADSLEALRLYENIFTRPRLWNGVF